MMLGIMAVLDQKNSYVPFSDMSKAGMLVTMRLALCSLPWLARP